MNSACNERGMALLMVLVVVALLSSLLIEFSFSSLVDLRATENYRDRTKAYYLARGGIEAGRMILAEDINDYDHSSEFWGTGLPGIPAGDGDISIQISDYSGRFNVNFVADTRGNPLPGYHRFKVLCEELLEIDSVESQALADSLVAWFNADTTETTSDDLYYAALDPPYSRRGGHLLSLDELRMVKGFSDEYCERLQPYLRVVGGERININSAAAVVLYAWQFSAAEGNVSIVFDRQDIEAIVAYRQKSAYENLQDLSLAEGIGDRWSAAWVAGSVAVKGEIFALESRGRVGEGGRLATALISKKDNDLLTFKME